jgi:hypothetical protein
MRDERSRVPRRDERSRVPMRDAGSRFAFASRRTRHEAVSFAMSHSRRRLSR